MTNSRIAKLAAFSAGTVAALSFATNLGAVTVAELQAQINALMAQLQALQGTTTVSTTFTSDLTVGSTGAQVVALQSFLESKDYLVMPVGVQKGYFGALTRAAVARYQAANSISPAVGYFGPVTRAAVNAAAGGSVVVPGGTSTGGTVGSTGSTSGVITTPGVEGTLTATLNSTPTGVKLYEGDNKRAVMGLKLEAKTSDIRVERIKVNLGSDTQIYRKVADRIYVMDGSTVLASADLNSDSVVKEGSNYFITLSGFGYVVPKDSTRVLTLALDAYSSIDSALTDGDSWTLTVPQNGVRGIDGAGIDQYAPSDANGISRAFTTEGDLAEDATLKLSLSSSSPAPAQVIASNGADENELDDLVVMKFDVRAEKDAVTITDLTATTTLTGAADASTIYLMDGNTVLGSESGPTSAGTSAVTFDDIDFTVSKDSTRTLTIAVDVRNATGAESTIVSSVTSAGIVAENSLGDTLGTSDISGSATGDTITIVNVGPQVTLNSKSISKSSTEAGTSTAQAIFNVTLKAVGGDISFDDDGADLFDFAVYKADGSTTTASAVSFSVPTSGVTTDTDAFALTEGNSVTLPVTVIYTVGPNTAVSTYSIGLDAVNWGTSTATRAANQTDFMAGRTEWKTDTIVLP
jgi:peptidoglycan hydrolase-like protein with peptidoglycan-binding domain